MRLAVAVAFLAIAACAGLQVWMNHRTAESWALDTALGESAGRHEAQTQRIGRLAALIALQESEAPRHVAELARLLDETRQLALKAQDQVTRLRSQEGDQAGPVVEAVEAWQAAQERLWYRADLMQSRADERLASLAEAGAAVQAEADRAGGAARALQQHLRRHAQERQESTVMAARVGAVFTVGLLLLLTLAVVRPALRTLHEQSRRLAQQAAENERLAEVAERTGKLVIITDAERRLVWANATFTRVTGWELHEALGRTPGELLQSERTDPQAVARLREALQAGQGARVELLNRSRDGRDYWIDADIQPQFDAQGGLTGFIAVEAVITEQVTERQRATALLAALPSAVVVHGPDGRVRDANPAARGLLGCTDGDPPEGLLDRHPAHEDLEPLEAAELPVARSLRTGQGERGRLIVITDGEGQRRWLLVNTEVLTDALGAHDGVVACYIDMTERRQLLEQLRDSAVRDALTRMPNRAAVLERVQRAIDHRRRHPGYGFAVLFMDVDRFKQVNDSLGHAQGDELLRQVAQRLEDTLRPGDTVGRVGSELRTAARIGGDEFVVVLEGVRQPDDVAAVADRILQSLGEPYRLGSVPVHVSVS
ncbi:MAG: diguanylate cyclase, partial [Rubrivivax sp.]|nr:diguanylate cyclase [Rubrivivax sp.]